MKKTLLAALFAAFTSFSAYAHMFNCIITLAYSHAS